MSTTVPVDVAEWAPDAEGGLPQRPQFVNPVPARVTAGGRDVGELDAFLQWDDGSLMARIGLPALPGHSMHVTCTVEWTRDLESDVVQRWIRSLDIAIDHVDDESLRAGRFEDRGMAERERRAPRGAARAAGEDEE